MQEPNPLAEASADKLSVESGGKDVVIVLNTPNGTYTCVAGEGDVGQKRCGVGFNPSQDADIDKIKGLAAVLMQEIGNMVNTATPGDVARALNTAMTHLESAQMFAVKGIAHTFKR